jgi:hypothetical protein
MSIRVAEVGKVFRLSTQFDMSANTALALKFTAPDGTITSAVNPAVTAPSVTITDPDLGELLSDEYMALTTLVTTFDQAGTWRVCGTYTASGVVLYSAEATFEVLEGC